MVSEAHVIFSSSTDKLQKNSDKGGAAPVARSLPKERNGGSKNEKGIVKYCLFVGSERHRHSGRSTNEVSENQYL